MYAADKPAAATCVEAGIPTGAKAVNAATKRIRALKMSFVLVEAVKEDVAASLKENTDVNNLVVAVLSLNKNSERLTRDEKREKCTIVKKTLQKQRFVSKNLFSIT